MWALIESGKFFRYRAARESSLNVEFTEKNLDFRFTSTKRRAEFIRAYPAVRWLDWFLGIYYAPSSFLIIASWHFRNVKNSPWDNLYYKLLCSAAGGPNSKYHQYRLCCVTFSQKAKNPGWNTAVLWGGGKGRHFPTFLPRLVPGEETNNNLRIIWKDLNKN